MARREQFKRGCKQQTSHEESAYTRKKVKRNPGKLYEVEIVDRNPIIKMVKLHYKNFSSNEDICTLRYQFSG